MRRQVVVTILLISSFIFQFAFSGYLPVIGIYPNFILSAILCISLFEQPTTAMIIGFIGGMLIDLLSGSIIGINAFTHTLSCYIVSVLSTDKTTLSIWKSILLIFITGVMNYSIIFVMLFLFGIISDYSYFPRIVVIGSVYNLFISVLILVLIRFTVSSRENYGEIRRIGSFRRKI